MNEKETPTTTNKVYLLWDWTWDHLVGIFRTHEEALQYQETAKKLGYNYDISEEEFNTSPANIVHIYERDYVISEGKWKARVPAKITKTLTTKSQHRGYTLFPQADGTHHIWVTVYGASKEEAKSKATTYTNELKEQYKQGLLSPYQPHNV